MRRQKLTWVQIANLTACPNCGASQGVPCRWEHAKTHWARTKKAYQSLTAEPRYVNGKARVLHPSEYRGKVSGGDISPYLKKARRRRLAEKNPVIQIAVMAISTRSGNHMSPKVRENSMHQCQIARSRIVA